MLEIGGLDSGGRCPVRRPLVKVLNSALGGLEEELQVILKRGATQIYIAFKSVIGCECQFDLECCFTFAILV